MSNEYYFTCMNPLSIFAFLTYNLLLAFYFSLVSSSVCSDHGARAPCSYRARDIPRSYPRLLRRRGKLELFGIRQWCLLTSSS